MIAPSLKTKPPLPLVHLRHATRTVILTGGLSLRRARGDARRWTCNEDKALKPGYNSSSTPTTLGVGHRDARSDALARYARHPE